VLESGLIEVGASVRVEPADTAPAQGPATCP
jgi:hypothetical protein